MGSVKRKTIRAVYLANNLHNGSAADFDEWLRSELFEAWERGYADGALSEKTFMDRKVSYARKSNPYVKKTLG